MRSRHTFIVRSSSAKSKGATLNILKNGTKPKGTPADPVNPAHYRGDRVMRIIEEFGLDKSFTLGNCIKYILRHESKGGLEDLRKAAWYLQREIANQSEKNKP